MKQVIAYCVVNAQGSPIGRPYLSKAPATRAYNQRMKYNTNGIVYKIVELIAK